jgi:hypothetical protein
MVSALLMLHRVRRALISYALGEGWNIVDALYFAVATLTTTNASDPDLVLDHGWMKIFTICYLLIGIGVLVEILRRLGFAFVTVRAEERNEKAAGAKRRQPQWDSRRGAARRLVTGDIKDIQLFGVTASRVAAGNHSVTAGTSRTQWGRRIRSPAGSSLLRGDRARG